VTLEAVVLIVVSVVNIAVAYLNWRRGRRNREIERMNRAIAAANLLSAGLLQEQWFNFHAKLTAHRLVVQSLRNVEPDE
jgi:hypothetical protein